MNYLKSLLPSLSASPSPEPPALPLPSLPFALTVEGLLSLSPPDCFRETFSLPNFALFATRLVEGNEELGLLRNRVVPRVVEEQEFWCRVAWSLTTIETPCSNTPTLYQQNQLKGEKQEEEEVLEGDGDGEVEVEVEFDENEEED